jgi:hypothetical protein
MCSSRSTARRGASRCSAYTAHLTGPATPCNERARGAASWSFPDIVPEVYIYVSNNLGYGIANRNVCKGVARARHGALIQSTAAASSDCAHAHACVMTLSWIVTLCNRRLPTRRRRCAMLLAVISRGEGKLRGATRLLAREESGLRGATRELAREEG